MLLREEGDPALGLCFFPREHTLMTKESGNSVSQSMDEDQYLQV